MLQLTKLFMEILPRVLVIHLMLTLPAEGQAVWFVIGSLVGARTMKKLLEEQRPEQHGMMHLPMNPFSIFWAYLDAAIVWPFILLGNWMQGRNNGG